MSLLLDLSRIRGPVEQVDRQIEPAGLAIPDDDFRVLTPVDFHAELRKDGRKVRLKGRMSAMIELSCSRCLDAYPLPLDVQFDLLFLPPATPAAGGDRALEDEDAGVSFYHDDQIDLGEVIREQFYLALPMKPLCRDECAGLCPVCGVNRNRETCSCEHAWVDPRLEGLRRFKSPES